MYFCPKSLCDERSYARHARYFAEGSSLRSDTPIYKIPMEKARWGAVCPGTFVPVLTLEGKCLRRRAKPAHLGGHLPVS